MLHVELRKSLIISDCIGKIRTMAQFLNRFFSMSTDLHSSGKNSFYSNLCCEFFSYFSRFPPLWVPLDFSLTLLPGYRPFPHKLSCTFIHDCHMYVSLWSRTCCFHLPRFLFHLSDEPCSSHD